tara:strand:+ start:1909 stop:2133 length:225 start_codon:yes stop_codon:yes gene_type:complete
MPSPIKNFIQLLAMSVFIFSAIVVILLFFIEVPEGNQRVLDMVLGVIIGSGLVSIISYYFGASDSNSNKLKEDI